MKKLSAILMLALLASFAFAQTIEIWEKDGEETDKKFWDVIIAEFMKANPKITVKRSHYGTEELRSQFQSSMIAGQAPEIIVVPDDTMGPLSAGGMIKDFDSFYPAALKRVEKNVLDALKIGGKYWGIPLAVGNNLTLLYNKKLTKKPETFNEIINLAKKYKGGNQPYALAYNLNEPYWFVAFLGAFGGRVFADDGVTPTLNTKAMVDALQFVADLKFKYNAVPQEADYNVAEGLFKDGKAATFINGTWSWKGYADGDNKITDFEWDLCVIPKIQGANNPLPYFSTIAVGVAADVSGDQAEAVKKFIDYLLSKDVQVRYAVITSQSPVTAEAMRDKQITDNRFIKACAEQIKFGVAMPTVPEMRAVWDSIRPELEAVMAGKKKPADAAKAMQDAAVKKIKEMK